MTGAAESPKSAAGMPEQAAEMLFDDPSAKIGYEPANEAEARRAVEHFGRLFAQVPGAIRAALDGARAGAEMLSGDRLQGISEIIQNADDAGAVSVHFRLVDDALMVVHDGRPVQLSDVLALATPWLSNKADDINATGRFGIGLMTLRALSDVLEVHSGLYHVRLGDPSITAIDAGLPHGVVMGPGATILSIPLKPGLLDLSELDAWLGRWDDSALIFCRTVEQVTIRGSDGTVIRTLSLTWAEEATSSCVIGGREQTMRRRLARSTDDRAWIVHSTETPSPAGVTRARKATGEAIPLALALPLQDEDRGLLYAGLPVVETAVPVRVNALFDPITSRQDLAGTPWNAAMLPLISDLWLEAVDGLFCEMPARGWGVVPSPVASSPDDRGSVSKRLEDLLLETARTKLITRLAFSVDGVARPLTDLAVEETALEGVITAEEVAKIAGLEATLPITARDPDARWREVLEDWRGAGAELPEPVTVDEALVLLSDSVRSPADVVALMAAGLDAGLGDQLAEMRCVVLADGDRCAPPTSDSLEGLVLKDTPLAERLGVGLRLHNAYLDAKDTRAVIVLDWLQGRGAIIDDADSETVVRRLGAAGRAGRQLTEPLTDDQLAALRDAFERMAPENRSPLGRHVGSAILLDGYSFGPRGKRRSVNVRPVDAYLPRTIDKEPDSFARAADKTPGLVWLQGRYADSLKSSLGRSGGLGAQKFLRLLGAEIAPRLVPHPGLTLRYAGSRLGVSIGASDSPAQRHRALRELGATYTLDDIDSPDLRAVAGDIAKERKVTRRRERAGALLGALGRAWDRLSESVEVTAAEDHYGWQLKGQIRASWLWSVGATAWLDDTDGKAQPPLDLRLRRPATIAVHGPDASGYLRPEFDSPSRREVLAALGVTGEPSTRDLVNRLRFLRDASEEDPDIAAEVGVVYEALAERMGRGQPSLPGDVSRRDLRNAFSEGQGLVRTQLGWRPPTHVLAGPPLFGNLRPFVPQVRNTDQLWSALHIRHPSLDDCRRVISEFARRGSPPAGADEVVLLETLRLLAVHVAQSEQKIPSRRLGKMALWTTCGWRTDRPVYAVDDPTLTAGLGDQVPVWQPGGELGNSKCFWAAENSEARHRQHVCC